MRWLSVTFCVTALGLLNSSLVLASGSSAGQRIPQSRAALDRASFNQARAITAGTPSSSPSARGLIAEEPYNLGKAVFSGKYRFGKPQLKAANVAEKIQRLTTLQRVIPAPEREKINLPALAPRLSNREMNALEYYLGMRFGKFITRPPSWASEVPPPRVADAR